VYAKLNIIRPEIAIAAMTSFLCADVVPMSDLDIRMYMLANYLKSCPYEQHIRFVPEIGNRLIGE
jgi:hypothetical protein